MRLVRWWMDLDLGDVKGLRDRLMESYLWGNIAGFEPEMGYSRVITSKLACLITLIDDCYDLFGTMEELELLTDFIDRQNPFFSFGCNTPTKLTSDVMLSPIFIDCKSC